MAFTKHSHGGWGGSGDAKPLRVPPDRGPVFPRRGAHGRPLPDILPRQTPGVRGPQPKKAHHAQ